MPVSQGSGGYMPGMTLRAWALVDSAGTLVKGYGVASVTKTGTGAYKLTMTGPALAASAIVKGTPRRDVVIMVVGSGAPSGNEISYVVRSIADGVMGDCLAHVEVYE